MSDREPVGEEGTCTAANLLADALLDPDVEKAVVITVDKDGALSSGWSKGMSGFEVMGILFATINEVLMNMEVEP